MTLGTMTTTSLSDSLNTEIDSARLVSEYGTIMTNLVDRERLESNTGTGWEEVALGKITATGVDESTEIDAFQQWTDTLFSIEPTMAGIAVCYTRRSQRKLTSKVVGKHLTLMQNALERYKDISLLTLLDSHSRSLGGAGVILTASYIAAARTQNATGGLVEPTMKPQVAVFHSYQVKTLWDEQVAPVGTYAVPKGMTEEIFRGGFQGNVDTVNVMSDDNLTLDSGNDVKGGLFAQGKGGAIVHVVGASPYTLTREAPQRGGGSVEVYLYEEYGNGLRASGVWGTEMYFAADAPTS